MWDDMTPYIVGVNPTDPTNPLAPTPVVAVLDPDLTPNHILHSADGGTIQVDWAFTVHHGYESVLPSMKFTATVYVDAIDRVDNRMLGTFSPAPPPLPTPPSLLWPYSGSVPIPPNSLAPGAYRITTLVTAIDNATNQPTAFAGFYDGPVIQVRE